MHHRDINELEDNNANYSKLDVGGALKGAQHKKGSKLYDISIKCEKGERYKALGFL